MGGLDLNPEKEIVNWWLNKRGFFTVNSIKTEKNKEINILAINMSHGKLKKVLHVETSCSISSSDIISPKGYADKFEDKIIIRKVKKTIKEIVGSDQPYEKVLVLGITSKTEEFKKLPYVKVYWFEDILSDVMIDLEKHNYRNEILRSLQLVKYILLANPKKLAGVVKDEGRHKSLKMNTREEFIKELIHQDEVKRILSKPAFEKPLLGILKSSGVHTPGRLAKAIVEKVLTPRTYRKFLVEILKYDSENIAGSKRRKKEKPLSFFFSK